MQEPAPSTFRVWRLRARNVRSIIAIDISPKIAGATFIGGQNGMGKTSVTDSIMVALGPWTQDYVKMVRKGQDEPMEIIVDLAIGEGATPEPIARVKRIVHADGRKSLEIRRIDDNTKIEPPGEFLKPILGLFSFDPLEFAGLKPRDRIELLLKVTGQAETLRLIAAEHDEIFEKRAGVNQIIRDLKGKLRDKIIPNPGPAMVLRDLLEEKNKLAEQARGIRQLAHDRNVAESENAAAESARLNVMINLPGIRDEVRRAELRSRADRVRADAAELPKSIERMIDEN